MCRFGVWLFGILKELPFGGEGFPVCRVAGIRAV